MPRRRLEELLPESKEILRSGTGRQVSCRKKVESSLDSVFKDRDYDELPVQFESGEAGVEDHTKRRGVLLGTPKMHHFWGRSLKLNLKSLAMETDLKLSGCPTPADLYFLNGCSIIVEGNST